MILFQAEKEDGLTENWEDAAKKVCTCVCGVIALCLHIQ